MIEFWWGEFAGRPQVPPRIDRLAKLREKYQPAIEAYQAGMTLPPAAALCGVTGASLHHAMKRLGIPRRRRGAHVRQGTPSDRDQQIITLRRTMTLRAIAAKFGITYQRVLQIVTKYDPDAGQAGKIAVREARHAEAVRRWTRNCAACDKPFVTPSKGQRHCGLNCSHASLRIDEQKHRDALAMRTQGWSWERIGREVYGWTKVQPGTQAYQAVTKWAKRTGYDLSYLVHVGLHAKKNKR